METTCNTIGGAYDEYGLNCYKGYTSPRKSWTSASNDCISNAPTGTQGRLAYVRTPQQWEIVNEFHDYWISAKTYSLNTGEAWVLNSEENWVPSDWNWYDSPTSIGPSLGADTIHHVLLWRTTTKARPVSGANMKTTKRSTATVVRNMSASISSNKLKVRLAFLQIVE